MPKVDLGENLHETRELVKFLNKKTSGYGVGICEIDQFFGGENLEGK